MLQIYTVDQPRNSSAVFPNLCGVHGGRVDFLNSKIQIHRGCLGPRSCSLALQRSTEVGPETVRKREGKVLDVGIILPEAKKDILGCTSEVRINR